MRLSRKNSSSICDGASTKSHSMLKDDVPDHLWCDPSTACIMCPNSWKKVTTSEYCISPGSLGSAPPVKLPFNLASGNCLSPTPDTTTLALNHLFLPARGCI